MTLDQISKWLQEHRCEVRVRSEGFTVITHHPETMRRDAETLEEAIELTDAALQVSEVSRTLGELVATALSNGWSASYTLKQLHNEIHRLEDAK